MRSHNCIILNKKAQFKYKYVEKKQEDFAVKVAKEMKSLKVK